MDFEYGVCVHACSVLVGWQNEGLIALPWLMLPQLYAGRPSWWERVECYRLLTVLTPPVLAYYTNLVFYECSGAGAVRRVAAIELVTMALG